MSFNPQEINEKSKWPTVEVKPNYNDIIDEKTYFEPSKSNIYVEQVHGKISEIIKEFGSGYVYIGKTGNPFGRMTGYYEEHATYITESLAINESYDSDDEAHRVPHMLIGYKKMFVIYQTKNILVIDNLEITSISKFKSQIRNKNKGGGGKKSAPPWFLYAVVHEDSPRFSSSSLE